MLATTAGLVAVLSLIPAGAALGTPSPVRPKVGGLVVYAGGPGPVVLFGGPAKFTGGALDGTGSPRDAGGYLAFDPARRMTIHAGSGALTVDHLRLRGTAKRWTMSGRVGTRRLPLLSLTTTRNFTLSTRSGTPALVGSAFTVRVTNQAIAALRGLHRPVPGLRHPVGGPRTAVLSVGLYGTRFTPLGGLEFDEQPGVIVSPGTAWATATQPDLRPSLTSGLVRHRGARLTLRALGSTGNGSVTLLNPIVAFTAEGGILTAELDGQRVELGTWAHADVVLDPNGNDTWVRTRVRVTVTSAAALNSRLALTTPLRVGDALLQMETLGRNPHR